MISTYLGSPDLQELVVIEKSKGPRMLESFCSSADKDLTCLILLNNLYF